MQGIKATQRKERHVSDALRGKVINKGIVLPMREVIHVLDAYNGGDGLRLGQLCGRNVAQAEMTDQPLLLRFGKDRERFRDGTFRRGVDLSHDAQVDHVERIEAEITEIVVDCIGESLLGEIGVPRLVLATASADLCDDD